MRARSRFAHRVLWGGIAWVGLCVTVGLGQSTPPAGQSGTTANSAQKGATGFAIESEMLTYGAMDVEGSAVACGVARTLNAADAQCQPHGTVGSPPGVVVLGPGSNALAEFQLWRTDMATMDVLTRRAKPYCGQAKDRAATSTIESIVGMIPEGQILSLAQALLTTTAETSPVEGNILDQTLIDDIAGHLRGLGLEVVAPDTYMPQGLAGMNEARSPFLSKLAGLLQVRACVDISSGAKSDGEDHPPQDAQSDEKKGIAQAIDAYLQSLTQPDVSAVQKTQTGTPPAAPTGPTISHLNAVLRADGLAQALGLDTSDGGSGDNGGWYVLWLKALESGGTLLKSGNALLGTKTSYSGGSVGTYALFRLNGDLECSGVFYNYTPPTQTGAIAKLLNGTQPAAAGKLVGGCNPNPR